ncbi:MAG: hypothetical protein MJZ93_07085 [Paludibacteraceae bacterium]|nr:hypothetical protein [Paludibacteraceae bacterium]
MKTHLRLHNGMNIEHKKTFIRSFLKMSLPPELEGYPSNSGGRLITTNVY